MKIKPVLSLFLGLTLFAACKNDTTILENNVGSFRGNVALVSAMGDTLTNYAGTTIQIQGTAFQTTSAANGDWQINNVPAGIYNILLFKPGFDTLIFPAYQFSGAGTSFLMSSAIQALPMDSLVFTLTNTTEESGPDSANGHHFYLGLLSMGGHVFGPDTLPEAHMIATFGPLAKPVFSQDPFAYLINDSLMPSTAAIGYNEPSPIPSGTVVTVQSYLYANFPKAKFTSFQQATSPFSVTRTLTLP